MLFQTVLFLMCFCMLLVFSRGFVVLRLPIQHNSHGTTVKETVSKQLGAQVEPDQYFELAKTAVTEAGFLAVFVMTLLAFSIIQSSGGMSDMRARMDKSEAERKAERKADKDVMLANKKEMQFVSFLTLLVAVIALKPDVLFNKLFHT